MRIEFVAADRTVAPKGGAVAVMAFEGGKLSQAAEDMDKATGGAVARALSAASAVVRAIVSCDTAEILVRLSGALPALDAARGALPPSRREPRARSVRGRGRWASDHQRGALNARERAPPPLFFALLSPSQDAPLVPASLRHPPPPFLAPPSPPSRALRCSPFAYPESISRSRSLPNLEASYLKTSLSLSLSLSLSAGDERLTRGGERSDSSLRSAPRHQRAQARHSRRTGA